MSRWRVSSYLVKVGRDLTRLRLTFLLLVSPHSLLLFLFIILSKYRKSIKNISLRLKINTLILKVFIYFIWLISNNFYNEFDFSFFKIFFDLVYQKFFFNIVKYQTLFHLDNKFYKIKLNNYLFIIIKILFLSRGIFSRNNLLISIIIYFFN